MTSTHSIPTHRKVVFSIGTVLSILVLLEGLSRWVGPPPDAQRPENYPTHLELDAQLGWQLTPGAQHSGPNLRIWERQFDLPPADLSEDFISSLGFRDSELATPKPEGQHRILCLGDSSVYGSGVERKNTFAEKLQHALNPPDTTPQNRPVEVINGGVPAYSTFQSLVMLHQALPLSLDGLIVYNMNSDRMDPINARDQALMNGIRQTIRHQSHSLGILSWLRYGLQQRQTAVQTDGQHRVPISEYYENLVIMAKMARSENLRTVFVIPPHRTQLGQRPMFDVSALNEQELEDAHKQLLVHTPSTVGYHIIMELVGRQYDIPVVNAAALFDTTYREDPEQYSGVNHLFIDLIHPSARGHQLLMDAILPFYQDLQNDSVLPN